MQRLLGGGSGLACIGFGGSTWEVQTARMRCAHALPERNSSKGALQTGSSAGPPPPPAGRRRLWEPPGGLAAMAAAFDRCCTRAPGGCEPQGPQAHQAPSDCALEGGLGPAAVPK